MNQQRYNLSELCVVADVRARNGDESRKSRVVVYKNNREILFLTDNYLQIFSCCSQSTGAAAI